MTQADQQIDTTSVVAVCSGGLDSTTMVYDLVSQGRKVDLVGFNYGQRHSRELTYMIATARTLGLPYDIVDLRPLASLLSGSRSSLVSDTDVPEGHYAQDNMKATVVPNRNMIMLSIAAGIAVSRGASQIATAVHGGDHFIYPDCRPEFIAAFEALARLATKAGVEGRPLRVHAPLIALSKAEIVRRGNELGVDFGLTVSCYQADEAGRACGRCDACRLRRAGFDAAGLPDPTRYRA